MPNSALAELIFIVAMMILILIVAFAAVFFFFKQYKIEMKQKQDRIAKKKLAQQKEETSPQ